MEQLRDLLRGGLRREGIGAEQQLARVASRLSVSPIFQMKSRRAGSAQHSDDSGVYAAHQDDGYVEELFDERVGCLLQGCVFDVAQPR